MKNHQETSSRYQFRLHSTREVHNEGQHQDRQAHSANNNNNNNNNNIRNASKTSNNMSLKSQMHSSGVNKGAPLKDNHHTTAISRKQFTPISDASNASFSSASVAGSIQDDNMNDQCSLTQAGLEEYNIRSSSYYDQPVLFHHQKQSSYAQSEGYHSYVSSSDSSSATPFLDRLRQESELLSRQSHHWSENDLSSTTSNSIAASPTPPQLSSSASSSAAPVAVSTVNGNSNTGTVGCGGDHHQHNNSSESTSSTETLKWLGSMSDVSEASHATGFSGISGSVSSSQLIVHSSRVRTPKRHHSESVLYLNNEEQQQQQQQNIQQISPTVSMRGCSPSAAVPPSSSTSSSSLSSLSRNSPSQSYSPSSPSYPPSTTPNHSHSSLQLLHPAYQLHSTAASTAATTTVVNSVGCGVSATSMSSCDLQNKSSISVTILSSETVAVALASDTHHLTPPTTIVSAETAPDGASIVAVGGSTNSLLSPLSVSVSSMPSVTSTATSNNSSSSSSSGSSSSSSTASSSYRNNHRLFPVSTYTEPVHSTNQLLHHPQPQYSTGLQHASPQISSGGSQPQSHHFTSQTNGQMKLSSPQQQQQQSSWQSVADRINDFERQQQHLLHHNHHHHHQHHHNQKQQHNQNAEHNSSAGVSGIPQKYTFIDPSKTHRVSNPALKAFQKNAVQSYFERQQQQQQHQQQQHSKENTKPYQHQHQQLQQLHQHQQNQQHHQHQHHHHHHHQQSQSISASGNLLRPHSFQPSGSAKEVPSSQMIRNSLPNTFGAANQQSSLRCGISSVQHPLHFHHHQQQQQQQHIQQIVLDGSIASSSSLASLNDCGSTSSSPAPPPPPPRSRSLMPTVLRRSSSASEYAEFRDQFVCASQEKLQAQSVKNVTNPEKLSFNDCGMPPPPPPPPRGRSSLPICRRTSSASEYAAMRDKAMQAVAAATAAANQNRQNFLAPPMLMSPVITANEWVPERPPKNPNLRIPSPDLPPPPLDIDTSLSDEPLPPPPPEILHRHHIDAAAEVVDVSAANHLLSKPPSPNRRNSFAGSSTRKTFYRTSSESSNTNPPSIPKKPTSLEILQASRPASSLAQQSNKAHKVILNGGSHHSSSALSPPTGKILSTRKRAHNPVNATSSAIPPILENTVVLGCISPNHNNNSKSAATLKSAAAAEAPSKSGVKSSPPPPLMPRMPITTSQGTSIAISSKLRCNSKASYLPRQSLDKLNTNDPDHGSYKLTLTSNEDCVNHHHHHHHHNSNSSSSSGNNIAANAKSYDMIVNGGKMGANLPDVLPVGVKLQQPSSPTSASANASPLRYGSNNNLSPSSSNQIPCYPPPQPSALSYPHMKHLQSQVHHQAVSYAASTTSSMTHNSSYTRSQSYEAAATVQSPPKFMSQSTIDLKKTHILEVSSLEEQREQSLHQQHSPSSKFLSPAQSENNITAAVGGHHSSSSKQLSPFSARKEFHRIDVSRKLSLEERGDPSEGRIVRAELVNTTLSISPCGPGKHVTRKDSLRENIEKITQLQSKLMSAHISESGLLGYPQKLVAAKVREVTPPLPVPLEEYDESPEPKISTNGNKSNSATLMSPTTTVATDGLPSVPSTPPPTDEEVLSLMDSATDGLKLMQRSEIILRVNPATVEAASQTDEMFDSDIAPSSAATAGKEESLTRTTLQPRAVHPIEIDCDNLSRDLASLLSPTDKLVEILLPKTMKPPSDYVSNLYNPNVPLRPAKRDVGTSTLMRMNSRKSKDTADSSHVEPHYTELETSLTNGGSPDSSDLIKKKVEDLMTNLSLKLTILNAEQSTIIEETAINNELGRSLANKVVDKVRPIDATKFRTYIDDVGHITSLLLSLSGRLAKTENSLRKPEISENCQELKILDVKRVRLVEQLEEAKRLKEDIDRRGSSVAVILEKNLTADEFADYDYFVNMKAKLIADARDITDKIELAEEQLTALSEALIQSDC